MECIYGGREGKKDVLEAVVSDSRDLARADERTRGECRDVVVQVVDNPIEEFIGENWRHFIGTTMQEALVFSTPCMRKSCGRTYAILPVQVTDSLINSPVLARSATSAGFTCAVGVSRGEDGWKVVIVSSCSVDPRSIGIRIFPSTNAYPHTLKQLGRREPLCLKELEPEL